MNWEPRHEKLYKGGVLIHHKVQRTPDGPWEDYVPEEPPPVKKAQPKAFPNVTNEKGMDLRDYFAGQVIGMFTGSSTWDERAAAAYAIADAMMKAREQ